MSTPHFTRTEPQSRKNKPKKRNWPCWARPTYEQTPAGLNQQIEDFVEWLSPTQEEFEMRKDVVRRLSDLLREEWPEAKVEVIGSCLTNLCVPTSDLDLVVFGLPEPESLRTLYAVAKKITSLARAETLQVLDSAKVPIIKLTDLKSGADIDISLSVRSGKENTQIVQDYVARFPLLRPLTLVIKYYLKQNFLNNPWSGGIGSYTLVIMIISYLQLHTRQDENPSLAELLIGFFELYGKKFDYIQSVISVVDGGSYLEKSVKNWENLEYPWLLAVEDPHNPDNDVGCIAFKIESARLAFEVAYEKLLSTHPDFPRKNSPNSEPELSIPQPGSSAAKLTNNAPSPTTTQTSNAEFNNYYQYFPDLAQIVWVNCQVQSFRQRIKKIYGTPQAETPNQLTNQNSRGPNQQGRNQARSANAQSKPGCSNQGANGRASFAQKVQPPLKDRNLCSK